MTTYDTRTPVSTTYWVRVKPVEYLTLITGKFTDWLEYIITDEVGNALLTYDLSWYEISWTQYNVRTSI